MRSRITFVAILCVMSMRSVKAEIWCCDNARYKNKQICSSNPVRELGSECFYFDIEYAAYNKIPAQAFRRFYLLRVIEKLSELPTNSEILKLEEEILSLASEGME